MTQDVNEMTSGADESETDFVQDLDRITNKGLPTTHANPPGIGQDATRSLFWGQAQGNRTKV